jgi:hypothetical protein
VYWLEAWRSFGRVMPSIPNDPARSRERRDSRPDGWKEEQADMWAEEGGLSVHPVWFWQEKQI